MRPLGLARLGGLWRDRNYRLFWQASTVSAFGTAVTGLALPLVATLTLGASPFEIGLIAFADEAPLIVFGIAAGAWVDRRRRLPIMKVCDVGRALVLLAVPLAWWQGVLSVPLLVGVALAVGTFSVFYQVASQAMVSSLLAPADFVEGNSKQYTGETAAMAAGPGLGGALMQLVGPAPAVLADVGSYLCSFACLRRMAFVEPPPAPSVGGGVGAVLAGVREIARNPYLRPVTLATASLTFVSGIGWAMLVPYASRELGLGAAVIGVALSLTGVGGVLGSLLAGRVVSRFGVGTGLALGLAAGVPGMLIVAGAGGPGVAPAAMLVGGVFTVALVSPMYDITQFSLRQAVTPDPLRGRVIAATRVAIRGCAALGGLAGGVVGGTVGFRGAILIAAVAPIIPLVIVLRSPVAALRTITQASEATVDATSGRP